MGASVLTSHLYLQVLVTSRLVRLRMVSLLWIWDDCEITVYQGVLHTWSMFTPGLGKTAMGCGVFDGMYLNISWPPLYHLTEYTCSPWESKSQPSSADPPPNLKGGTVTFLSKRQFVVDKRNMKARGRRKQSIAILFNLYELLSSLLQSYWKMGSGRISSREGWIEAVRQNRPEV